MSLPVLLVLMVLAGIIGGAVNYLLPANKTEHGMINKFWQCVVLGFGATILVPLFLELAQSKLLENLTMSWPTEHKSQNSADLLPVLKNGTRVGGNVVIRMGEQKRTEDSIVTKADFKNVLAAVVKKEDLKKDPFPLKNYFLYMGYCLVAASAGYRFINMLISNVVKEEKINKLLNDNDALSKEKDEIVKQSEKRIKNGQISQAQEAQKIAATTIENVPVAGFVPGTADNSLSNNFKFPDLSPVTHADDPQKGRFGGKSKVNGRELKASVSLSDYPGFYKVIIWVESTDPESNPLGDVVFYIHDSFSPSVYTISPPEFTDGKALDDEILSYGAFTVGVITDNGNTLLELDLAEIKSFPKDFRDK